MIFFGIHESILSVRYVSERGNQSDIPKRRGGYSGTGREFMVELPDSSSPLTPLTDIIFSQAIPLEVVCPNSPHQSVDYTMRLLDGGALNRGVTGCEPRGVVG